MYVWRILPFHNVDAGLPERVFEREEEQGSWRSRVSSCGLQFLEFLPLLSLQFFFIQDERGQSCHSTTTTTAATTWLHFKSPKSKIFTKRTKTWNEIPSLANPWSSKVQVRSLVCPKLHPPSRPLWEGSVPSWPLPLLQTYTRQADIEGVGGI